MLGEESSDDASRDFEEIPAEEAVSSVITECLLFCCRVYTQQGLTTESEKVLQLLATTTDASLPARVRIWNEVRVCVCGES